MKSGARPDIALVRVIDRVLTAHYRIFAFTDDPACVFRLGPARAPRPMVLADGTCLARNEPLLEMHFWNERLPVFDALGATAGSGLALARSIRRSLFLLAGFLSSAPEYAPVRALHAEIGFLQASEFPQLRRLAESLGFDFAAAAPPGPRFWKRDFWANFYSWWLMWAYNPASLRGKHFFRMARCEVWLSRAALMERYGQR